MPIKSPSAKHTHNDFLTRALARTAVILTLAGCGVLAGAQDASATSTPITLGTAGSYGILVGTGDVFTTTGGLIVSGNLGNVGLGKNGTLNYSGNNTISGTVYMDSGETINGGSGTTNVNGYVTQSMTQAITDATTASTSAGALTATSGLTDQGGALTSSVTITAMTNLSENVLDLTSVSLSNGTITFNDASYSGAKYIINVTGNFSLSNTTIKLGTGVSASDILFNIEGTGKTVSITGGTTMGTLLIPASNATVGGTLTGAIIAGVNNAGKSYTLTTQSSGINITSLPYIARTASKVPEPSSIALFGTGLIAAAAIRFRRRRAA